MTVYIFGNEDLDFDSIPLKILPELRKEFPHTDYLVKDPNEEWDIPEKLIVIDTVMGINEIKVFDNLDSFSASPSVTMHDFDVLANLRFLKKLGKLSEIKIVGIPPTISEQEAFETVKAILAPL